MSRVLMFAGVREVPQLVCALAHAGDGQAISPSQICVSKNSQGSCRGDSGGPLMVSALLLSFYYNFTMERLVKFDNKK